MKLTYRTAGAADAPAIAHLHATNWQLTYRGAFTDDYLDNHAPTERLQVWTERFSEPNPRMITILAENEAGLQGFCCIFLDYGPDGHLLDNLHVTAGNHGKGIGKTLMRKAAEQVAVYDTEKEIYLWVLTTNTNAMAMYEHLGGRRGRTEVHHFGQGNRTPALALYWSVAEMASL
ncbi:MAG: GNAT family N-acetyltransferase [Bacteroidota bacterium]